MTQEPAPKPRSWQVTDGVERAPHRSMFYAMGFTPEDLAEASYRRGEHGE